MFLRKNKPAPKKYYIPEEYIREFCELKDRYNAAPAGQDNAVALSFWRFVKKVTGAEVDRGSWTTRGSVLCPYVEEINV